MTDPGATKASRDKKRRRAKFLPHIGGRKAAVPSGVQGFLITCVGGRERVSVRESINMLETFFEAIQQGDDSRKSLSLSVENGDGTLANAEDKESTSSSEDLDDSEEGEDEGDRQQKTRRVTGISSVAEGSGGIDELLEAELCEIRVKKKARFSGSETGCHGIIFVRMRKDSSGPTPVELAQAIVQSAADTKKTCTRHCLRVMPAEATMYASVEEVQRAAKSVILQHFPAGSEQSPIKFAIVCESRANTSVDKKEFIRTVAELVPQPHIVDLKHPDKTILVQIVKTTCVVGVVDKFKELAKYNIRQLTSEAQAVPESETRQEEGANV